jgi:hypothetical protein
MALAGVRGVLGDDLAVVGAAELGRAVRDQVSAGEVLHGRSLRSST